MKTGIKTGIVLIVIGFLVCVVLAPAFAAESDKSFKKASKDAARSAVNYPANLTNKAVGVVGGTVKNAGGMVVDTAKATGETLTGDIKKAPKIVETPIRGTVVTAKDAVVGTVEAPVKAGKETAEQNQ